MSVVKFVAPSMRSLFRFLEILRSSFPALPCHRLFIILKKFFSFSEFPGMDASSFPSEGRAHGRVQHFVVDDECDVAAGHGLLVEYRIYPDGVRPFAVASDGPFSHGVARAPGPPRDRGVDRASEVFLVDLVV